MRCAVCEHNNLEGLDSCENCGADLRTVDIPGQGGHFQEQLLQGNLALLQPRSPIGVRPSDSAATAIKLMQDETIGCVLVNDGDTLVGIFTERDALMKLAGKELQGVTVGDVMTSDPVVLRDEDSLAVALHKMAIGGFRHIPLVEGGRAVGIVSSRDIFRHIIHILN